MATPPKHSDRRAQRTRQLVRQAGLEVIRDKGFTAMTIQDVADRANVNRGTFYAHFPDKYALLEALVRDQFRHHLMHTLPPVSLWERQTVRRLIQVVLEYFAQEHRHCEPADVIDPFLERAANEELATLLVQWLQHGASEDRQWRVPVDTLAWVISWTILGAAIHWSHDPTPRSSEQVADDILLVIGEGVTRLAPLALPM